MKGGIQIKFIIIIIIIIINNNNNNNKSYSVIALMKQCPLFWLYFLSLCSTLSSGENIWEVNLRSTFKPRFSTILVQASLCSGPKSIILYNCCSKLISSNLKVGTSMRGRRPNAMNWSLFNLADFHPIWAVVHGASLSKISALLYYNFHHYAFSN